MPIVSWGALVWTTFDLTQSQTERGALQGLAAPSRRPNWTGHPERISSAAPRKAREDKTAWSALVDGTMLALDRRTGVVVWKYKVGGGINGWMSVAGDTIIVPVGSAKPPFMLALSLPNAR